MNRVSYHVQILSSTLGSLAVFSILLNAPWLLALEVSGFFWMLFIVAAIWNRKTIERERGGGR